MSYLNCLYIGNVAHTKWFGPAGAPLDIDPLITGKGLRALEDLPNLEVVQPPGTTHSIQATGGAGGWGDDVVQFPGFQVVPSNEQSLTEAKSIAIRSKSAG